MDPEYVFQYHKRMDLERTRQLEYQRVARERTEMMGGAPPAGWSVAIRRWWRVLRSVRVVTVAPSACCATPVICS